MKLSHYLQILHRAWQEGLQNVQNTTFLWDSYQGLKTPENYKALLHAKLSARKKRKEEKQLSKMMRAKLRF